MMEKQPHIMQSLMLIIIFSISFLFLNISLFNFSGFYVTGAVFFIVYFFVFHFYRLKTNRVMFFLGFVIFLLFNAILQINSIDLEQFFRSFSLTLVFMLVYMYSFCNARIKIRNKVIHYFIIISATIILGVEVIQIFEQFYLGEHKSWFYLAEYSTSTAVDVGRFQDPRFLNYMRPISIYYEPSFLGFCLLMLYAINDVYGRLAWLQKFLILGVLFSLSATMIFFLIMYLILQRSKRSKYIYIYGGVCIVFVCIIVLLFPEIFRLNEILSPGTSGHERIMRPIELTLPYLKQWPFGLALGQSEVVFNNSFFLLILYTGCLFPLIFLFKFFYVLNKTKDIMICSKYFIILFALLFLNGALFTLEGAFFIFLINFFFSIKRQYE